MMSGCCVRFLLTFSIVLFLFPPETKKYPKLGTVFNLLSWLIIAATIIGGPLTIVVKDSLFTTIPTSSKVVYDISLLFLFMSNICISLVAIFKKNELREAMNELIKTTSYCKRFNTYFSVFLFILIVNTFFIILTQLKRTKDEYYRLTVFVGEGFMTCRIVTYLFIIFLLINSARRKARRFNETLLKSICHKRSRLIYNNISDFVEKINNLFGITLLLIIYFFISNFLRHAVYISLNYTSFLITIVRGLWIISYGFQAIYLAHVGDDLSKETKITISTCYKMIHKAYFMDNYGYNDIYLLAQEASHRKLTVSAFGFFNIDNTMIMFIMTNLCTYLIVVLQVLQKNM
ncbi:uncharacterized protein LOC143190956 [Rhynchophorus ferrugineus]|uniref:Gustatory receptor n=1 Tax=Rhynchophorus ferrugineus TaxID=354439 RepID=A0A834HVD1_RHYFE|nr:hypothetical protein GWI33_021149 [Rhynchophorus ferrugineus]